MLSLTTETRNEIREKSEQSFNFRFGNFNFQQKYLVTSLANERF